VEQAPSRLEAQQMFDRRSHVALRAIRAVADDAAPNAFNRPECAAAIRLEAGASRSFTCGARFHAAVRPLNPNAVHTA
jgi:hypothetical protein